mmetsp:Transcript_6532/g.13089  ORF Transcript_6532/g.13089 Transcript_6532/m.13089 type:complete len:247 (+) Transcript_6532:51-791(+)
MTLATLTLISSYVLAPHRRAPSSYVLPPLPPASPLRRAGAVLATITQDVPTQEQLAPWHPLQPWQLTANGLKFLDADPGSGPSVAPNSVVSLHYTVSFAVSGQLLGTTRGKWPLSFAYGKHDVPLFSDAIAGMRVGGTRRLVVPAEKIPPSQMRYVPQDNYAEGLRVEITLESIETGVKALIPSLLPPGNRRLTIARALFALSFLPYLLPAELKPDWYQAGDPQLIYQAHQLDRMLGGATLDMLGL